MSEQQAAMQADVDCTLDQVAHEFEVWRTTRQHKGRIPDRLWQSALSLIKSYPASQVAQQIHLNYSDLKRRLDNPEQSPSRDHDLSFIELGYSDGTPITPFPRSRCLFDVETGSGTRFRCTVDGVIPDNLLRFLHSLR